MASRIRAATTADTVVPCSSASAFSTSASSVGIRDATAIVQVEATIRAPRVRDDPFGALCLHRDARISGHGEVNPLSDFAEPAWQPLYLAVPCGLGQRVYRKLSTTLAEL